MPLLCAAPRLVIEVRAGAADEVLLEALEQLLPPRTLRGDGAGLWKPRAPRCEQREVSLHIRETWEAFWRSLEELESLKQS